MADPAPNPAEHEPKPNQGVSRRTAIKRAAGAGIIMSSLSSGSALASITCQKFSNWMSGSGSPRLVDELQCASGRSPGYWVQPQSFSQWVGVVPPACTGNCRGQGSGSNIDDSVCTRFSEIFFGGVDDSFWKVLGDQPNFGIARPFAAAYLNATSIGGYPMTPLDVQDLWNTYRDSPELAPDIIAYLQSTYED